MRCIIGVGVGVISAYDGCGMVCGMYDGVRVFVMGWMGWVCGQDGPEGLVGGGFPGRPGQ